MLIQRFSQGRGSHDSAPSHSVDGTAFTVLFLSASSTPANGEWVISNQPSGVCPIPPVTHRSDPIVTVQGTRPGSFVAICNYRL